MVLFQVILNVYTPLYYNIVDCTLNINIEGFSLGLHFFI